MAQALFDLSGRTALVTGSSRGLGRAIAEGLARAGARIVVNGVDPSSKMAESGLRRGDVIQEVNHQSVKNVSEFQSALKKGGDEPLLLVNRGGRTLYITA